MSGRNRILRCILLITILLYGCTSYSEHLKKPIPEHNDNNKTEPTEKKSIPESDNTNKSNITTSNIQTNNPTAQKISKVIETDDIILLSSNVYSVPPKYSANKTPEIMRSAFDIIHENQFDDIDKITVINLLIKEIDENKHIGRYLVCPTDSGQNIGYIEFTNMRRNIIQYWCDREDVGPHYPVSYKGNKYNYHTCVVFGERDPHDYSIAYSMTNQVITGDGKKTIPVTNDINDCYVKPLSECIEADINFVTGTMRRLYNLNEHLYMLDPYVTIADRSDGTPCIEYTFKLYPLSCEDTMLFSQSSGIVQNSELDNCNIKTDVFIDYCKHGNISISGSISASDISSFTTWKNALSDYALNYIIGDEALRIPLVEVIPPIQ